jgi:hypothetical protein
MSGPLRQQEDPCRLVLEKIGEQQLSAVVIKGGNQRPFRLGIRRPAMKRGVVLNERANGAGDDLASMSLLFRMGPVTSDRFSSINNRGERYFNPMLPKPILGGRIVEGGNR